jgi:hypothetical protein
MSLNSTHHVLEDTFTSFFDADHLPDDFAEITKTGLANCKLYELTNPEKTRFEYDYKAKVFFLKIPKKSYATVPIPENKTTIAILIFKGNTLEVKSWFGSLEANSKLDCIIALIIKQAYEHSKSIELKYSREEALFLNLDFGE